LKPSPVALALFAALERDGIRYCHWKSNIRLPETLSGLGDIDLLVHPADAHSFQRIISECGFKLTTSRFGVGHPGVFHAIALDPDSGRLLDLHAYHQMISGDSYVKSYRFAIEEEFLACTSSLMGVRVPEASAECLLFMLRHLLKHTSILEVRKVNAHSKECRDELSWLLAQSDIEAVSALLAGWFPTIDIPVQEMIDCVRGGSVAARVRMGMRVAWALRRQRRIGHVAAAFSRLNRFVGKYIGRRRSRRNLSLLAGGAFIALAGPKGTGKSTLTKLMSKQLGSKLRVKRIHFGKPPASWATFMPRLIVAAGRKAFGDGDDQPDQHAERGYSTWFVISKYLVAIDRRRLLTLSMRQVASGTILISDRCHVTNGTRMDGSAFDDLAVERARSSLQRWLMERERAIYRCLPRPSLVLKLRVSLEKALERDRLRNKPGGPNPQAVQRRWARESESEFAKSAVCLIDVDGEIDEALRAVTTCVWDRL
jgi:thymidylate kinase